MNLLLNASVLRYLIVIFLVSVYIFPPHKFNSTTNLRLSFPRHWEIQTHPLAPMLHHRASNASHTQYLNLKNTSKISEESQQQARPCGWGKNMSVCGWFFFLWFLMKDKKTFLRLLTEATFRGSNPSYHIPFPLVSQGRRRAAMSTQSSWTEPGNR